MPKLVGIRERMHKVYYDTLINVCMDASPKPTITSNQRLFQGLNLGQTQWTNMYTAGHLPSENTFIVQGMLVDIRIVSPDTDAAKMLHEMVLGHLHLQLVVGDKCQFDSFASRLVCVPENIDMALHKLDAATTFHPVNPHDEIETLDSFLQAPEEGEEFSSGTIVYGDETTAPAPPPKELYPPRVWSLQPHYFLEKPIAIPARQDFRVVAEIVGPHAQDVIRGLNRSWECWRCIRVELSGILTRDVL
jgi:hypothetical protein